MIRYYLAPALGVFDLTFKRATDGSVGFDLHANVDKRIRLYPPKLARELFSPATVLIGTGLHLELPIGFEAQVRPRSSFGALGIHVPLGTIDTDYRGEVKVRLVNLWSETVEIIEPGDRIAQLIIAPVWPDARSSFRDIERADTLEELTPTVRDDGGFGSTGR